MVADDCAVVPSRLLTAAACTIARMVVIDLAKGLNSGLDPYDALRDAASGSLTMDRRHANVFRLLADLLDEEERDGPAS